MNYSHRFEYPSHLRIFPNDAGFYLLYFYPRLFLATKDLSQILRHLCPKFPHKTGRLLKLSTLFDCMPKSYLKRRSFCFFSFLSFPLFSFFSFPFFSFPPLLPLFYFFDTRWDEASIVGSFCVMVNGATNMRGVKKVHLQELFQELVFSLFNRC